MAIAAFQASASDADRIDGIPVPPSLPVRPLHALISVGRLVRNKEDTRQVFEIIKALAGGAGRRLFARFLATPYGRRVVTEPVRIEKFLGDRELLRALPEGSLGRAYLAFMEGENLTPEGLLAAAGEAGLHAADDAAPVVGMDQRGELGDGRGRPVDAEDAQQRLVPMDAVLGDVPAPGAAARRLQRGHQPLVRLLQLSLRLRQRYPSFRRRS